MVLGLEGRGDGRGYRWEAVLIEQEEKLKGEVSILDLYSSVTSWGHVTRAPPSGKEPELFALFFVSAFREPQERVNTVSTQLLVCACSLHWVRLRGNHRNKNGENIFVLKKAENNKNSKGLQLNTHIRRIYFGDIYNHAVRKERNDDGLLFYGQRWFTYLWLSLFKFLSAIANVWVIHPVLGYIHPFWGDYSF